MTESEVNPLGQMVGFRNVLVHGYGDVDLAVVRDILQNHLDDLLRFATTIREKIPESDAPY